MKIETVIKNYTNALIEKAKNEGIYENFGQKEVSKLKDKFINSSSYNSEMNHNRELIRKFDDWAMDYCG